MVRETDNKMDKHAVAVQKNEVVVRHLPREHSKIFWFFLKNSGTISVKVTDRRRHSGIAGGLEIPCQLTFTGPKLLIERLKKLL